MIRFDDIDDHLDDRDRREKLAAVVRLEIGELRQEIFVDAPEDVAVRFLKRGIVEDAQEVAEHVIVEFCVFGLGQRAGERGVVLFDRTPSRR